MRDCSGLVSAVFKRLVSMPHQQREVTDNFNIFLRPWPLIENYEKIFNQDLRKALKNNKYLNIL